MTRWFYIILAATLLAEPGRALAERPASGRSEATARRGEAAERGERRRPGRRRGRARRARRSERRPCLNRPVRIVRAHARPPESRRLALTRCDGSPNLEALEALSLLARPKRVDRPSRAALRRFRRTASPRRKARFVAPGIARLHPGLLTRLQALADRWPGRAIEIVSGYRPRARRTSRHRHGRALDLRVEGVPRRVVARFARTLPETGVGYYPNSTFTHVDVRQRSVFWVDRSGPGEPPDYGPWPPRDEEIREVREAVVAEARRLASELDAALADVGPLLEGALRGDDEAGHATGQPDGEAVAVAARSDDAPQHARRTAAAPDAGRSGQRRADPGAASGPRIPDEGAHGPRRARADGEAPTSAPPRPGNVPPPGNEALARADEAPEGGEAAGSPGAAAESPVTTPEQPAAPTPPAPTLEPLPRPEPSWEGGIRAVEGALAAWSELPAGR